jgi:hypothetical protein
MFNCFNQTFNHALTLRPHMNNELVSDAIVLIHFIKFFHAFISFINQNKIWTIESINDFSFQKSNNYKCVVFFYKSYFTSLGIMVYCYQYTFVAINNFRLWPYNNMIKQMTHWYGLHLLNTKFQISRMFNRLTYITCPYKCFDKISVVM